MQPGSCGTNPKGIATLGPSPVAIQQRGECERALCGLWYLYFSELGEYGNSMNFRRVNVASLIRYQFHIL